MEFASAKISAETASLLRFEIPGIRRNRETPRRRGGSKNYPYDGTGKEEVFYAKGHPMSGRGRGL